jgi:hypothetical protein
VGSVVVEDRFTKSSKFRKIIQPIISEGVNGGSKESEGENVEPWFTMCFAIRPLDDAIDYKLNLNVQPISLVLAPPLLDRMYDFFRPEKHIYVVSDLRSAAYSQLDALGKQTAGHNETSFSFIFFHFFSFFFIFFHFLSFSFIFFHFLSFSFIFFHFLSFSFIFFHFLSFSFISFNFIFLNSTIGTSFGRRKSC